MGADVAIRGTADQRAAAALAGLASVVFGVLALSWPDVTVLVIAVVFGARTVLSGLSQIALVFSHRHAGTEAAAGAVRIDIGGEQRPGIPPLPIQHTGPCISRGRTVVT